MTSRAGAGRHGCRLEGIRSGTIGCLGLELALGHLEIADRVLAEGRVLRIMSISACAMTAAAATRANHLRSAGMTYHGAHSVLVCVNISEKASW